MLTLLSCGTRLDSITSSAGSSAWPEDQEWKAWKAARAGRQGTLPLGLELADEEAAPDDVSQREFARHVLLRALALQRD